MISLIVAVVIIFLALALLIALVEASSGCMGDSSMAPGCLGVGLVVLASIIFLGWCSGQIGVWIK